MIWTLSMPAHSSTITDSLPRSLDAIALPTHLPPIVLIAFTRPELVTQVLTALNQQTLKPDRIIAYLDGPRNDRDAVKIQECVDLLAAFSDQIPVEIRRRSQNLGCDRNTLEALTEISMEYEWFIHLEDDVIPNSNFYDRMVRLLKAYQPYPEVFSISAYANFPDQLETRIPSDFMASNRVFSLGFAVWSDRWQSLDLLASAQNYNPFFSFANIPANLQTQYTIVNQFFIEKNRKIDWVITMTLAALAQNYVHIIPKRSFVHNIGCGHPDAKTYSSDVPDWINQRYCAETQPNTLPETLKPLSGHQRSLTGRQLIQHFQRSGGMWLDGAAMISLWKRYSSWSDRWAIGAFWIKGLPTLVRRWRSGLPT
jgi:Glycosyl transferase family 2